MNHPNNTPYTTEESNHQLYRRSSIGELIITEKEEEDGSGGKLGEGPREFGKERLFYMIGKGNCPFDSGKGTGQHSTIKLCTNEKGVHSTGYNLLTRTYAKGRDTP